MKSTRVYIAAAALLATVGMRHAGASECGSALVGAWEVQAQGAPYEPHLFIFHADRTMITTNPSNVQESSTKPRGGTNDSLGMGVWSCTGAEPSEIVGTFFQLNAYADDHQPAARLAVTFRIKAAKNTFSGQAAVKVGETPEPGATLIGDRIAIDRTALGTLQKAAKP